MTNKKIYTVESVTAGHPDKVCDQISDAILDECLRQDQNSRVAVESFGGHGLLVIGGEITTNAEFDAEKIARKVYKDIGYNDNLEIIVKIVKQSPDIAQGVDTGGAGDQGIMYGYASNETDEYLPKGIVYVHKLTKGLEDLMKSGELEWLCPDGKAQVTVEDNKVKTVLLSTQHDKNVSQEEIREKLIKKLIKPVIGNTDEVNILINPTGKFVQGGFEADTGLTGRKIMVDTYGGLIPHGGGAFSGKDATKVDRSAAYMTRYVAKNIVANKFAKEVIVSVAYAIGHNEPLMVAVIDENGKDISHLIEKKFDFRPKAIVEHLRLKEPIFAKTASYGHFGKNGLPWEKIINFG
ncbi:methionine adenosyltransferase [Candidatus Parcubacteria bacterium]|nr:methionine adenosyltransferase [Candidatus Parcubacteria bacterium]